MRFHCHEVFVSESFEDLGKPRLFPVKLAKLSVEFGVSEQIHLVQVVIFPFLTELLFDLSEDLSALCISHCSNTLHDFTHKISEGCIVTLPRHLNTVLNEFNIEFEFRAFGKVCKLSQVLFQHAHPDLGEDAGVRGCTKAEIGGVDLERDYSNRLFELVVF